MALRKIHMIAAKRYILMKNKTIIFKRQWRWFGAVKVSFHMC